MKFGSVMEVEGESSTTMTREVEVEGEGEGEEGGRLKGKIDKGMKVEVTDTRRELREEAIAG